MINTKGMTRQEWLQHHQGGLGGSDIAAAVGMSRWKTPLDLFLEKTGKVQPPPMNNYMEAGIRLENAIAKWYMDETGRKVVLDNKIRSHKKYQFLIADFDRLILKTPELPTGILEVKTTNHTHFRKEWSTGQVPIEYKIQLQHYMFISGHRWGSYAVLGGGVNFLYFDIYYDEDFIKPIEQKAIEFWNEHVLKNIPPEPINKEDVDYLYPEETPGRSIELSGYGEELWYRYKEIYAKRKEIDEEIASIKDQFAVLLKDAEEATIDGEPVATYKSRKLMTLNTQKLKKENPFIYNGFLEQKESRLLKIKK